ncbi:hypothetical protein [Paraburkholderia sediminicola]|uniref:hypothetical protein n=1 Tax=Paraburkholderia sediminicola TaxID=458836 RepID=UPI0038B7BBBA
MSEFTASTLLGIGGIIFGSVAFAVASTATDNSLFTAARICLFIGVALIFGPILMLLWVAKYSVVARSIGLGVVSAVAVISVFLSIVWVGDLEVKNTPKLFSGDSVDPVHPTCQTIPEGALKIFLGSNLAWSNRYPHTILRVRGVDMLVIDQDKDERLIIKTLRVFDESGTLIARFDDGEIWNSGEIRTKRSDKSTLIVYDKSDVEVMRVRFVNKKSLEITGTFFHPPTAPVFITSSKLSIGGMTTTNSCFGSNEADIVVQ